jgi:hypothetical protein
MMGSEKSEWLAAYIEDNEQIFLIPTIVQEILQGIREDAPFTHKSILSYMTVLQHPPLMQLLAQQNYTDRSERQALPFVIVMTALSLSTQSDFQ